jgi:hypothetical protein
MIEVEQPEGIPARKLILDQKKAPHPLPFGMGRYGAAALVFLCKIKMQHVMARFSGIQQTHYG